MNSKGSFTAIISAALLVLIATVGFTYYSAGNSQQALIEQRTASELRQHWTQVRYLLDKATSYYGISLIPTFAPGVCNYSSSDADFTALKSLYDGVLRNTNGFFECQVTKPMPINPPTQFSASFVLSCDSIDGSINDYNKTVVVSKAFQMNGPACSLYDVQGDYFEN